VVGEELRAGFVWLDGALGWGKLVLVCDEQFFDLLDDTIVVEISETTIRVQTFTSFANVSRFLDETDDLAGGGISITGRLGRGVVDFGCFNNVAQFGVELGKVKVEELSDAVLDHSSG